MMVEDGYLNSERCSVLVTSYEALGTMLVCLISSPDSYDDWWCY